MDLNIIKILGILIVTLCCIIATYTDIKYGIIPNKLTIPTIIIGLSLVTLYYFLNGNINLFYYCSVIIIFLLNYILWILGLWAGGDVKLFTAISTLLISDFLSVLNNFQINNFIITGYNNIPTLYLMLNSVFAVIPLITIYFTYEIIKDKNNLIKKIYRITDLKESITYLNLTVIGYLISSLLNVDNVLLKIVFSLVFMRISYKKLNDKKNVIIILSLGTIIYEFYTFNMLNYIITFILINMGIVIVNIFKNKVLSTVLTCNMKVDDIKRGMILKSPLCKKDNHYYFNTDLTDNFKIITNQKLDTKIIIKNNVSGLTREDLDILIKLNKENKINKIPIKKTLPFAPFILCGLFITLIFGNLLDVVISIMVMI